MENPAVDGSQRRGPVLPTNAPGWRSGARALGYATRSALSQVTNLLSDKLTGWRSRSRETKTPPLGEWAGFRAFLPVGLWLGSRDVGGWGVLPSQATAHLLRLSCGETHCTLVCGDLAINPCER